MNKQFRKLTGGAKNVFGQFSSKKYVGGSSDFLNSNSIIAKFAFILLVILIFVLLLRLGTSIITWIMSPSPNPILLDGMADGTHATTYHQDPKIKDSVPILRSVNDVTGVEFTWSIWLFVKDSNFNTNSGGTNYKHIFHKGNNKFSPSGFNVQNNCPGLYLDSTTNTLVLLINTFKDPTVDVAKASDEPEALEIPDIPINKWINVIIRVSKQNQLDLYINGTLMKREILNGVVKQNYGDVYLTNHHGFHGYTSSLRYFNKAIGTNHIQTIVDDGPNLNMKNKSPEKEAVPRYLSTRWFFSDSGNLYNPSSP